MRRLLCLGLIALTPLLLSSCGLYNAAVSLRETNALSRGTWEGDVYTNTFAGITFHKPEEWNKASDEEIAAIMGAGADMLKDDISGYSPKAAELKTITDAMVQNPLTGSNMSIIFENLSLSVGGTSLTEEGYHQLARKQLEQVTTMDFRFNDDTYEKDLNGETYSVMEATVEDMGMTQYYFARKQNTYMLVITITVLGDDSIQTFYECFPDRK